jgi:hypothetical protein
MCLMYMPKIFHMLNNKQQNAVFFVFFFTALLFAIPRLYSTYTTFKSIQKKNKNIEPPFYLCYEKLSWGTHDKPSLTIEFKGVCSTMGIENPKGTPEKRRLYVYAKLTNVSEKPLKVSSLEYKFNMIDVNLVTESFFILEPMIIPAGESRVLNNSRLIELDILSGISQKSIDLSATAIFGDAT